jgi:hypothetical protein
MKFGGAKAFEFMTLLVSKRFNSLDFLRERG